MINLEIHADIKRLVNDSQYANDKNINVISIPSVILKTLKRELLAIKSSDPEWTTKVSKYKALMREERVNANMFILKYNKSMLTDSNSKSLGLFRSVVTDGERVLAYAPPKSINIDDFKNGENVEYLEYVDGTMINVYYDDINNKWEIATRSNVGAKYNFFDNCEKTFNEMFFEAFNAMNLDFKDFKKGYSYSFVLQHPENRIVVPIKDTRLILTNVYKLDGYTVQEMDIYDVSGSWVNGDITSHNKLMFPQQLNNIIDVSGLSIENICNVIWSGKGLYYDMVGAMLINRSTGDRTKIRNPMYEYVRELRGNNAKLQYHYYYLMYHGKVTEFLKYFPELGEKFQKYREQVNMWTKQLNDNYASCYIRKEKELKNFPFEFRSHMFQLHQKYLNNSVNFVSRSVVINFVNDLIPPYLMSSINYPFKRAINHS